MNVTAETGRRRRASCFHTSSRFKYRNSPQLFVRLKQQFCLSCRLKQRLQKDGGHSDRRWTAAGPHPADAQNQSPDQDLHNQAGGVIVRAARATQRSIIQAASRVLACSLCVYILNPFKICICK